MHASTQRLRLPIVARRNVRVGFAAAWLVAVIFLVLHHAFWRDEVRALSIALQGDGLPAMLRGLHGEGHPALWYILLRGAHALIDRPEILPIVSLMVAAAAVLLLVLRAPFGSALLLLLLFSRFCGFEYSVMARNYGISMLLLFVIATTYSRLRQRGVWIGALLFLLANTNVHSAVLVGAFLLFWLFDIVRESGPRWTPALRTYLGNALIATAGVAVCAATVYPPFNDAAVHQGPLRLGAVVNALVNPASSFPNLTTLVGTPHLAAHLHLDGGPLAVLPTPLMSLLLFATVAGLIRSAGAFVAALASLLGLSLLFTAVYPGSYRHEALWLVFVVTLHWIELARARVGIGNRRVSAPWAARVSRLGWIAFVGLVALQLPYTVKLLAQTARGGPPLSRSRDFAGFVAAHPGLHDAILIADPDYLLEPMRYYLSNPTYLVREQRFGPVVIFTKKARFGITLNDLLASAARLHGATGKPVLILLHQQLSPNAPAASVEEVFGWTLRTTPQQVRRFLASTRMLARFAPADSDESFDVYSFKAPS